MKKKYITFTEIKKYLKEKGLVLSIKKRSDYLKNDNLNVLLRTFISGILIISVFYGLPVFVDFKDKRMSSYKEFKNESKNIFENTLENKKLRKLSQLDDDSIEKYIFEDVFEINELPNDYVRLSAATLEQLFKDTNYNLKDVRKTKLVKPISLSLLPHEIKKIENIKARKKLFIQIILPLVLKENNNIKLDRKKLFSIINKNKNTTREKKWLKRKFKQYGVQKNDLSTLKVRMDEIPVSIAIAQAAKETGWGVSRFAQEGNALFGQWTWTGEGIKPAEADNTSTHKVMKFNVLQASVKAYQRNLNTHNSYRNFRSARAELRDRKKKLDSLILTEYLDKYAETGKEYVKILQQIIRQNKLTDFDDAKLLPSSIELESLI